MGDPCLRFPEIQEMRATIQLPTQTDSIASMVDLFTGGLSNFATAARLLPMEVAMQVDQDGLAISNILLKQQRCHSVFGHWRPDHLQPVLGRCFWISDGSRALLARTWKLSQHHRQLIHMWATMKDYEKARRLWGGCSFSWCYDFFRDVLLFCRQCRESPTTRT